MGELKVLIHASRRFFPITYIIEGTAIKTKAEYIYSLCALSLIAFYPTPCRTANSTTLHQHITLYKDIERHFHSDFSERARVESKSNYILAPDYEELVKRI